MGPTTPFEESGGTVITTADQGLAFVKQIASETDAIYEIAGYSHQGREIPCLIIGSGLRPLLLTGGVHPNETVAREAVLRECRRFCYDPDPIRAALLSDYRIIILPTVNPDSVPSKRDNAQNININRDHFALETPEARVMADYIQRYQPEIVLDVHEHHAGASVDMRPYPSRSPNAHAAINNMGWDLFDFVCADIAPAGYSSAPYFSSYRTWWCAVTALRNSVGLLVETSTQAAPLHRFAVQDSSITAVWKWCVENASSVSTAVGAARQEMAEGGYHKTFLLQDTDSGALTGTVLDPMPSAYTFQPGELDAAATHIELFGIVVDVVDGAPTVALAQEAAAVIPYLFDADSLDAIVAGARVYPPPLPPSVRKRATRGGWVGSPAFRPSGREWVSI